MSFKLDRRAFVVGAAGLALAGCDRLAATRQGQQALGVDGDQTGHAADGVGSELTWEAQKALPTGELAEEYPASAITKIFKPNGSIDPKDAAYKKLAAEKFASYAMEIGGLVEAPRSFTLADFKAMPSRTQITRHDCVEGWSCIGQWTGVPMIEVLDQVRPKPEARFVVFHCYDRYATDYSTDTPDGNLDASDSPVFYGSIDMREARHPQTLLAYSFNGGELPVEHGAPVRLRVPRQLGYKNTKYIKSIELVSSFKAFGQGKGGYWEDQGYEWYGGI